MSNILSVTYFVIEKLCSAFIVSSSFDSSYEGSSSIRCASFCWKHQTSFLGICLNIVFGDVQQVGMAALLASVCSVPLTSVLLLFELTKDYHILLPLMVRSLFLFSFFFFSKTSQFLLVFYYPLLLTNVSII